MSYLDDFNELKAKVNVEDPHILLDNEMEVCNMSFTSRNCNILPGLDEYICRKHEIKFINNDTFFNILNVDDPFLNVSDSRIGENHNFKYQVFKSSKTKKVTSFIFLFHGFNEKYWHKYLPWAKSLVERTGKAVVLFPLAFHMNRAPHAWSDRKKMFYLSEKRKEHYPNILHSSLSNVAISIRLHSRPQRFFWSGLQTYRDVIQFIKEFKARENTLIDQNASFDIFSYSIGSFLSQILMMSSPNQFFDKSKLFIFCGGATFNRFSPVTKYILDSEANVALYSFMIEHLENHLKNNKILGHFFGDDHYEGICFRSMLNYKTFKTFRESKFKEMASRITAVTLEKDTVIPPYEVINTLQGDARNIPIRVEGFDFPYDYIHEEPFPAKEKMKEETDEAFRKVFDYAGKFLKD